MRDWSSDVCSSDLALFGVHPAAEAVLATRDGTSLGFALFFHNFSTWTGRRGLYLEDLYVTPEARGVGVGAALLRHLAGVALDRGCGRFEWAVLDWNEPAKAFYARMGAELMADWRGSSAPRARRSSRFRAVGQGRPRHPPSDPHWSPPPPP